MRAALDVDQLVTERCVKRWPARAYDADEQAFMQILTAMNSSCRRNCVARVEPRHVLQGRSARGCYNSVVAKRSDGRSGNLDQAMTLLVQSQASLIQNQASFLSQLTETHQRLARIELDLDQIKAILLRHEQMLNDLPEAIRQKIGFKSGSGSPPAQAS